MTPQRRRRGHGARHRPEPLRRDNEKLGQCLNFDAGELTVFVGKGVNEASLQTSVVRSHFIGDLWIVRCRFSHRVCNKATWTRQPRRLCARNLKFKETADTVQSSVHLFNSGKCRVYDRSSISSKTPAI